MAAVEPKTAVNQFCQKKTGRQITKTDIAYACQKHGNAYQSTITLNCLGGVAFVGELVGSQKLAEAAAASQVLKHYAAEIAALAAQPPAKKSGTKRPASAIAGGVGISGPADKVAKLDAESTPALPSPPKKEINEICTKIVKRTLTKNEIVYNSRAVAGGFQATLQLTALPGVYGQNMFTGTVCANKKDAEVSVATIAIQTLKADAEFSEILNKPKEIKKGKGKGKGKGQDPALFKTKMCENFAAGICNRGTNCTFAHSADELQARPHIEALAKTKMCNEFAEGTCTRGDKCTFAHDASELKARPKYENPDWGAASSFNPMMEMMWNFMGDMMGGVGMGMPTSTAGGGKKKDGKKERVSTEKVSGTVKEWKGSHGWIEPSKPYDHEKAKMHAGKIFLAKSDVPAGTEMKAGTSLTFHVYADKSGLGAEDISL